MIRAQTVYSVGGYSLNFASPGPIGGTTPGAGTFTTLQANTYLKVAGNVDGGMLFTASGGTILSTAAATNGQVMIGRTGLSPDLGTITGTTNQVVVTNGSGSITLSAPGMVAALNVNTTAVGNVGGGTDDLMTYSLPANSLSADGKGVRITAWGTVANNANAKTLTVNFGSVTMATDSMTINGALNWLVTATIFRTGSSAQTYIAKIESSANGLSVRDFDIESGTATETDTGAITIKCTGAATADNDIVQKGLLVEFIN